MEFRQSVDFGGFLARIWWCFFRRHFPSFSTTIPGVSADKHFSVFACFRFCAFCLFALVGSLLCLFPYCLAARVGAAILEIVYFDPNLVLKFPQKGKNLARFGERVYHILEPSNTSRSLAKHSIQSSNHWLWVEWSGGGAGLRHTLRATLHDWHGAWIGLKPLRHSHTTGWHYRQRHFSGSTVVCCVVVWLLPSALRE